ncbi:MAG: methyltransferase domain-containing protein [Vitreimonas sp.]
MTTTGSDYEALILKEKNFFSGEAPEASIPPIFTYWASRYLSPRLTQMFGSPVIEEIFANEITRVNLHPKSPLRIISLGSGECSLERDIAKILIRYGVPFRMICTDVSPAMLDAGRDLVGAAGIQQHFEFVECDVNAKLPGGAFDAVIANHCLHHFVNLEYIFDWVKQAIAEADGCFVVSDMIGRNGHMRWPEALVYVENFWDILPSSKKYDWLNGVQRDSYVNFDCAAGALEGIRAQDILPIMVEKFNFERFVGYGNLPDIFIDRMYGPNFSPDTPADVRLIDLLEQLNTDLTMTGAIKPTMMFATVRVSEAACKYDVVSPQAALRRP